MDSTSYRSNRQPSQNRPDSVEPEKQVTESAPERPSPRSGKHTAPTKKDRGMLVKIIIAAVVVLLLAAGVWFFMRSGTVAANIDGGKVQAVFFTNGQVYFGKLKVINGEYMKLNNIFYLQAKASKTDQNNPQETTASTASDVELIKLGSEIHGPEDEMVFNKTQVLFFENLKQDGNVSTTIANYQEQNKN